MQSILQNALHGLTPAHAPLETLHLQHVHALALCACRTVQQGAAHALDPAAQCMDAGQQSNVCMQDSATGRSSCAGPCGAITNAGQQSKQFLMHWDQREISL